MQKDLSNLSEQQGQRMRTEIQGHQLMLDLEITDAFSEPVKLEFRRAADFTPSAMFAQIKMLQHVREIHGRLFRLQGHLEHHPDLLSAINTIIGDRRGYRALKAYVDNYSNSVGEE